MRPREFASIDLHLAGTDLKVPDRTAPRGQPDQGDCRTEPGAAPRGTRSHRVGGESERCGGGAAPLPLPQLIAVPDVAQEDAERLTLSEASLILYPQRDSNPCCRLERAKS